MTKAFLNRQDSEYSTEIDVDMVIEQNRSLKNEVLAENEEMQSLLQIAHENKTMRACIYSLQEQVNRLEAGIGINTTTSNHSVIPKEQAQTATTSQFASASKSVAFSSDGDYNTTLEGENDDNDSQKGRTRSITPTSRKSHAQARTSTRNRSSNQRASLAVSVLAAQDDEEIEQQLSHDTFGFLLVAPFLSAPYALAIWVLFFQILIYSLMIFNLLKNGQPFNVFAIPGNVSEPVWVAQLAALLIAVISQDDIRTAIDMLREGYTQDMREVFPHSNPLKFVFSITSRFMGGSLGLMVSFLLIVTSETVIDLLLNFTALAFTSGLDELGIILSGQGFAGRTCLKYAAIVSESRYRVPKTMVQARKTFLMLAILIGMLVAWGFVRVQQTSGAFLCSTILVQMGDEMRPELGTFTGLYDIADAPKLAFRSNHAQYIDRAAGNTRFSYCHASSFWSLQYRETPDGPFPDDPCTEWKARSDQTSTFDLTAAAELRWFVNNEFERTVLLEPFFLHCYECGRTMNVSPDQECNGRGTCNDAVCACDQGWHGLRCEFMEPCPKLAFDSRSVDQALVNADLAALLEGKPFEILVDKTVDPPKMVEVYNRPVYLVHLLYGHHMVVFFTGRRWASSHTGLMPDAGAVLSAATQEEGYAAILGFFKTFHAHWTSYAIEYTTDSMDFGTPENSNGPMGLLWYEAEPQSSINQTIIQAPNLARPTEVRMLCGTCDVVHNPCHFDGVCMPDRTCQCSVGAKGALCESSPVGNGRCDDFYNIPYFDFDGGDCCDSTCISTVDYTCGESLNGYINYGYPNCRLAPGRWQPLRNSHIEGSPLSLAGYSVAMSHAGTLLAVGEPEQSRATVYDRDGSLWIPRWTLQGVPDSWFGVSLSIAAGSTHWRNNPNFRAPLVLLVGVAPKDEPWEVRVYTCGNDVKCYQKDALLDVNGLVGPEAYEISKDGRVVAYGRANPGTVHVYEIIGDYYEGEPITREVINPGGANVTGSEVLAVRLSQNGNVLAVFESTPAAPNVLRVYEWNGSVYQPRGGAVLETNATILQRQVALSGDGSTIIVGLSECPNLDIMTFRWVPSTSTWISLGSPPMREEKCNTTHLAWSVATDRHGLTLAAGAFPSSDWVTVYSCINGEWNPIGNSIDGHYPGSETAIALSGDGAHLVVGLPYAGKNEEGVASTYSLPYEYCPPGNEHHFRLSLTTDYEPEKILWGLEDVASGEIIMSGGPYAFSVGTLVEEECISTESCHAYTIYNLAGPFGLGRPGRFDLFVDGENLEGSTFQGRAKRITFGSNCLTCPAGEHLVRMMVHTCQGAEWKLENDSGSVLVSGTTPEDMTCDNPNEIEMFYWEETCIDEGSCYSFTVTNLNENTNSSTRLTPSLEYLVQFDDDTLVASDFDVLTSVTTSLGACA